MKKVIAFDLDDTLAVTKQPMSAEMADLLVRLAAHYEILIISGGRYDQIKTHAIDLLEATPDILSRFHVMPTCGAQYYRYDQSSGEWQRQYAEILEPKERKMISETMERVARELGYWEANPAGDIIEDRESQITYSALGQKASPEAKAKWDPTYEKRHTLRAAVERELPGYEIRIDGRTSLNVTTDGIDKGYGMQKLQAELGISAADILFVGDKLDEGGNDYPVKALGIDTIAVSSPDETAFVIEGILGVSSTNNASREA